MLPWSRWITPQVPSVMRKRFDTRFFVAAMPRHQTAQHDEHEATACVWLTPRTALSRYWAKDIELAPPQIMSLVHLLDFDSVRSVLQAACAQPPPLIEPESFEQDGTRVVCYPGDPRHAVALANDTPFGLGAAVFGPHEKAMTVASALKGARITVNEGPLYQDPHLVVGGIGDSGLAGARPKVEQLVFARRTHVAARG